MKKVTNGGINFYNHMNINIITEENEVVDIKYDSFDSSFYW